MRRTEAEGEVLSLPKLLAEQKRMRDEAEGDAHADGVENYSKVGARPDNEVSRRLCPRGYARESLA